MNFEALKGISLKVNKGEILALLGPNGAGKTSLISTICGITNPSSGSVVIDGYDISKKLSRRSKTGWISAAGYNSRAF